MHNYSDLDQQIWLKTISLQPSCALITGPSRTKLARNRPGHDRMDNFRAVIRAKLEDDL